MEISCREELESGAYSFSIGIIATYAVSYVVPTSDLTWALIAVGFASFFSGFFSHFFAEKKV